MGAGVEAIKWYKMRTLLTVARSRAKRQDLDFALDMQDLELPDYCPVLGLELDYQCIGIRRDNSPSLDRLNPDLGYIPGNVTVISWRANRLKSDASLRELELLIKYVRRSRSPAPND